MENNDTRKLKTNIPDNPFENGDGESEYEMGELDYKQNVLFNKFLKKNGFDDFGDWWKREGKDRILEMIDYGRRNNKTVRGSSAWWKKWMQDYTK